MNMPEPLFVGKNILHFTEIESTNNFASELVTKTNPSEGTAIISDFQTAGKGQIGRYWHSEAQKNLLVSFILYPKSITINEQFMLNIISALAVADVVSMYKESVSIKWPNDIYVANLKIAGILVQNSLRNTQIKSTVIGIGLNVNQVIFPDDLPNPTSLFLETGTNYDLGAIFRLVASRLEYYYLLLKSRNLALLRNTFENRLYLRDEWAWYIHDDEGKFEAKITGVEKSGKLMMYMRDGKIKSYAFREIRFMH
ncbi:MAG: biotin--[acetyl-CoA-carboxylase] ligase [Saprospiraceae bacterium]|nr:biotin--[acetyl-CoA-carboxylase] ligase [Saprospiraceae bacterium]